MNFFQSFKLALQSIQRSRTRAFLTMLGIIIGVAAVTVIVGMGNGMKNYIEESFESMGTNLITASITGRGSDRSVSVDDMYALADDYPSVISYVSPIVSVSATVRANGETASTTSVSGVSEDYYAIKRYGVADGRFLQYVDILRLQKVCVVGSYVAATYYDGDAVGKALKINGDAYTIVGVLKEEADNEESSTDDAVYIPYTNAAKLSWARNISSYSFSAASEDSIDAAEALIKNTLYNVYESDDYYTVTSMTEMLSSMTDTLNIVVLVLGAIAAISLVVGGIGIMNIMLVSVTERTREIGIRKSLGAKKKDIMQQFVIEAATVSALGGILGIAAGYLLSSLASQVITKAMDATITVAPSGTAVFGAFAVSVAIGIIFGYLPARKAANLNPIDALRYE